MSKLKAGRGAVWVTERAIQILGGYGYVRENPVERWHRDSKIYDIFEGTEQIQQLVISRATTGMHISSRCCGAGAATAGPSVGPVAPSTQARTELNKVEDSSRHDTSPRS